MHCVREANRNESVCEREKEKERERERKRDIVRDRQLRE